MSNLTIGTIIAAIVALITGLVLLAQYQIEKNNEANLLATCETLGEVMRISSFDDDDDEALEVVMLTDFVTFTIPASAKASCSSASEGSFDLRAVLTKTPHKYVGFTLSKLTTRKGEVVYTLQDKVGEYLNAVAITGLTSDAVVAH